MDQNKEFKTVAEILEIFPFSRRTLCRMEGRGLRFYRPNGGKKLYRIEEIEAFMLRQKAAEREFAAVA